MDSAKWNRLIKEAGFVKNGEPAYGDAELLATLLEKEGVNPRKAALEARKAFDYSTAWNYGRMLNKYIPYFSVMLANA